MPHDLPVITLDMDAIYDEARTIDFIGGSAPAGTVNRYPGGKNGAGVFQTIINHIPHHHRYVEAFAGSAAVFRNMWRAPGGAILIERDAQQADKLRRDLASPDVTVLQESAIQALPRLRLGEGDFVYCDPPYLPEVRRQPDMYRCEMDWKDHCHLLDVLDELDADGVQWALSGYQNRLYSSHFNNSDYTVHRVDYQAQTRRGVVTESLWMNYDPARVTLHDYGYLGTNFRERERIARKVNRWVEKLSKLPHHERRAIMRTLNEAEYPKAAPPSTIAISGDARSSIARSGERIRDDA